MKKTLWFLVFIILVLVIYFLFVRNENKKVIINGYKNTTYIIAGESVKLVNGLSEHEVAPGSSSKIVTRYFGNEVKNDFDGDGREDVAFILTQQTGGSGTFYYLVASLNKKDGYVGSHAVLIGDRIAPQTTELGNNNTVIVNYADRKPGESFAVQPSVGKSLILKFDPQNMDFGEVVQNFEGEANPSSMSLYMKTWSWINTKYNDGKVFTPKQKVFTLTFNGNQFSAKTDCNGVGGEYSVNGKKIVFSKMMSTLMYCEGSEEAEFSKMLGQVESFLFTSKGELVLGLKMDSGSMIFR